MKKTSLISSLVISLAFASQHSFAISAEHKRTNLYQQVNGSVKSLLLCAKEQKKLVVVAHRGGYAPGFPENALNTLERANHNIPTILEIDIVSSVDGIDYLHHDKTLDRTTTGSGRYDEKEWSEIKALRLRDDGYSVTKQHPVSFDEMLSAMQGKAFLMLDMKDPSSNKSIIEKIVKANMLQSSIFIAYNHQQAKDILTVAPNAMIAVGASSPEQVEGIKESGLDKTPFVALSGAISSDASFIKQLNSEGHFPLGSSFYGEDPADARLFTQANISDFDNASRNGFQMVVSNRPLAAHKYLSENNLALRECPAKR